MCESYNQRINSTVSASQRGCVLFCLWHIWFIWVKYGLKGSKICFSNKNCLPWECQRSAVMVFTLFHNSQICNLITVNIYVPIYNKLIISIAFSVFTVYTQLWEILSAPCIKDSLHFISPERIYVCEYVRVTIGIALGAYLSCFSFRKAYSCTHVQ